MEQWLHSGKRIRPGDKDLVFHTAIWILLPVFILVVALFHAKAILEINWQDFHFPKAGDINVPYLAISCITSGVTCLLLVFVMRRYRYDWIKQLYHRQKLARMILENKWYEAKQVKSEGIFEDSSSQTREKISYFPKVYYRMKDGLIQIRAEITLGKYQEQLLHFGEKAGERLIL